MVSLIGKYGDCYQNKKKGEDISDSVFCNFHKATICHNVTALFITYFFVVWYQQEASRPWNLSAWTGFLEGCWAIGVHLKPVLPLSQCWKLKTGQKKSLMKSLWQQGCKLRLLIRQNWDIKNHLALTQM